MANSAQRVKEHSSGKLAFFAVSGIILITLGVLTLLSVVGGLTGAIFDQVKSVMLGLGGTLCIGMSLLLAWGGLICVMSVGRGMSKRGFFLATIVYLSVLGIINLLSYTDAFDFMDYVVWYNSNMVSPPSVDPMGYWSMIKAGYSISAATGTFGGALGMVFGWPAWTYLKAIFGTVVLALLCLICVIFFSRLDLRGMLSSLKMSSEERRQAKEAARAQEDYRLRMEEYQKQLEEAERLRLTPAYRRRGKKGEQDAAQEPQPAMPPVYAPYPVMPVPPVAVNPYGYAAQPDAAAVPVQPVYPPVAPLQPAMYDELVVSQPPVLPFKKASGKGKRNAAKADAADGYQVGMTFTPAELGAAEPIPEVIDAMRGKKPAGSTRKTLEKLEDIRRRKAELAVELQGNELAAESVDRDAEQTEPAHKDEDRDAAYKRPSREKPVERIKPVEPQGAEPREQEPYVFPSIDLLNRREIKQTDTRAVDTDNARKLEKTLESFAIPARVQRVTHGPAVTRFELGLMSSGINVKRILSIADNIALDMASNGGVRIEIPIPGTNLFGIEVPNAEIQSVTLAEVLTSPEMAAAKSPLAVALGRDITGQPIICDLAKMPHLLIAGQTGSGKSVCINSIINSLLFRSSPEEVRMIMIDPKVVELQCYNVVPHLLIPVVSDPHKAAGALAWAVAEMLDRYHRMQTKKAREINVYNSKLEPGEKKMPRIVIIIDELADLMFACKKEVEDSIIRLAQLARAAGIHMVVATQRPTVDVITGLIKSNVPSRIAFAVSSNTDSRTILDEGGAEKLLGRGDMLYMPTGVKPPKRVQGCFLSDAETERVVDYIASHSNAYFDPDILEAMENEGEISNPLDGDEEPEGVDDRLQEAIEMVVTDGQASISMLQRRMKLGYARAGRLIDDMAARGIVSKSAGSKPREVLMSREEYEQIKDSLFGR